MFTFHSCIYFKNDVAKVNNMQLKDKSIVEKKDYIGSALFLISIITCLYTTDCVSLKNNSLKIHFYGKKPKRAIRMSVKFVMREKISL